MRKGRDLSDYLTDILTATADASAFTSGMDYEAFEQDRKTVNAVIRNLEVIGEAPAQEDLESTEIPGNLRSRCAGKRNLTQYAIHGTHVQWAATG